MKQTCILILGMHRSGTSAFSGTLNFLGVYLGSSLIAAKENENAKGFFENIEICKVNEKLLSLAKSNVHDDFYNPKKLTDIQEGDAEELKKKLIDQFKYSQLFAIKDPRIGYLLPIYIQALKSMNVDVKIVIPFRNPLEVAGSLNKRNGFSIEKGLLHWAYHILSTEYFSRGLSRVFTQFDELVEKPEAVIKQIDTKLQLDLTSKYVSKKEQIREFLTPDLKHHNIAIGNLSDKVPKIIRDIVSLVPKLNEENLESNFDELRQQLFDNQTLFYNDDVLNTYYSLHRTKQDLEKAKQGLQEKDKEIELANQGLQAKDKEIELANQGLQAKDKEIEQANQGLQAKDKDLEQARKRLQSKDKELEQVKHELTSMYLSKSWKITRPMRQVKRFFRLKK